MNLEYMLNNERVDIFLVCANNKYGDIRLN